jgi:L-asparagine transporter-like permease
MSVASSSLAAVDPSDLISPAPDSSRQGLFRYLTAEESADYLAIMDLFSATLMVDLSAAEVIAQLAEHRGQGRPSPFRLPFATPLCVAVLAFLALVTVLLGFAPDQRVALYALPVWAVLLVGGYYLFGRRTLHQASDKLAIGTSHSGT